MMKVKVGSFVTVLALGFACSLICLNPPAAFAQDYTYMFSRWHPALGSWFGRAVPIGPCTPGTAGCQLPPELFMVLNIADDGNFIGNDSLTFGALHTTAHGRWAPTSRTQITANYVVLAGGPSSASGSAVTTPFFGAYRMRWLANSVDSDDMTGFVNVWFFPFVTSSGVANIDSTTWVPKPDPLADLGTFITDKNLSQCDPTKGCVGVFTFKIRRVGCK